VPPKGRYDRSLRSLHRGRRFLLGWGGVRAARVSVTGRERGAKFIAVVASHYWNGVTLAWVEANEQDCVLILRDREPVGLVTTEACEQGIHRSCGS
jgi:RNA polymerase sigma-70 factor (ECF subfamily)